jgi:Uma2 family endonuclease
MSTAATSAGFALPRRRFTVSEYHRMEEVGILQEDERIELVEGGIIEMGAISVEHALAVTALTELSIERTGQNTLTRVQCPIHLGLHDEPRPDIALVVRRRYRTAHPTPAHIFLVIEVADTSLEYERVVKLPLYAAAGVRETWLVDLRGETIERHSEPRDGRYARIQLAGREEMLGSTVLPFAAFSFAEIVGPYEVGEEDI